MKPLLKVALIGNPTVGKSTLFSRLTGIGVIISNYPGTTVEVAHGRVRHDEVSLDLSDLPGVYSLDTDTPGRADADRVFTLRTAGRHSQRNRRHAPGA